jgi:hypothetical protein
MANGGNGSDGSTNLSYTGGGGGGGGGGGVIVTCNQIRMDATSYFSVQGGTPGATGSGAGAPTAGANGRVLILTPNGIFGSNDTTPAATFLGSDYPNIPVP